MFLIKLVNRMKSLLKRCIFFAMDCLRSKNKYCLICQNRVGDFYPSGIAEDVFKLHHIVGGGIGNIVFVLIVDALTGSVGSITY